MNLSSYVNGVRTQSTEPIAEAGGLKPFASTHAALLRYIELYRLNSTPRSIPLGTKKTHVGKTDSHGRWEKIQEEFTALLGVFPKSGTEEWYLLTIPESTNLMLRDQLELMEEKTGERWTKYRFERRSLEAFRDLKWRLEERGMLIIEEKKYTGHAA